MTFWHHILTVSLVVMLLASFWPENGRNPQPLRENIGLLSGIIFFLLLLAFAFIGFVLTAQGERL